MGCRARVVAHEALTAHATDSAPSGQTGSSGHSAAARRGPPRRGELLPVLARRATSLSPGGSPRGGPAEIAPVAYPALTRPRCHKRAIS